MSITYQMDKQNDFLVKLINGIENKKFQLYKMDVNSDEFKDFLKFGEFDDILYFDINIKKLNREGFLADLVNLRRKNPVYELWKEDGNFGINIFGCYGNSKKIVFNNNDDFFELTEITEFLKNAPINLVCKFLEKVPKNQQTATLLLKAYNQKSFDKLEDCPYFSLDYIAIKDLRALMEFSAEHSGLHFRKECDFRNLKHRLKGLSDLAVKEKKMKINKNVELVN